MKTWEVCYTVLFVPFFPWRAVWQLWQMMQCWKQPAVPRMCLREGGWLLHCSLWLCCSALCCARPEWLCPWKRQGWENILYPTFPWQGLAALPCPVQHQMCGRERYKVTLTTAVPPAVYKDQSDNNKDPSFLLPLQTPELRWKLPSSPSSSTSLLLFFHFSLFSVQNFSSQRLSPCTECNYLCLLLPSAEEKPRLC